MFRDSGERQWAREWLDRTLNPTPSADAHGTLTLAAAWAEIHGGGLRYQPEQRSLQGWWSKDYASWPVTFAKPGRYQVNVTYSFQSGEGGSEYVVEVAGQKLTATAAATKDWSDFRTDNAGVIELQTPDQSQVVVRLLKMTGQDALHLRSVALAPVK